MNIEGAPEPLLTALASARLPRAFYAQPAVSVAPALLGTLLVSHAPMPDGYSVLTVGQVVETEAYDCPNDPACWAYRKRTARNSIVWGGAGYAYIYPTYRLHMMLNVVVEHADYPATVLVRAVAPVYGLEAMRLRRGLIQPGRRKNADVSLTNGPGKLSVALGIDSRFTGIDLAAPDTSLFFASIASDVQHALASATAGTEADVGGGLAQLLDPHFHAPPTVRATRIGLSQGGDLPWRYYYLDDPYVSARDRSAEAKVFLEHTLGT